MYFVNTASYVPETTHNSVLNSSYVLPLFLTYILQVSPTTKAWTFCISHTKLDIKFFTEQKRGMFSATSLCFGKISKNSILDAQWSPSYAWYFEYTKSYFLWHAEKMRKNMERWK